MKVKKTISYMTIIPNINYSIRESNSKSIYKYFFCYLLLILKVFTFDIEFWNYFNQYRLRTNNPCEGFNNKLNSYFDKKPTFYNLINILAREELLVKKETENTIINGFKKLCRIGPSEYYELVQYFIEKENDIKGNTLKSKKEKINLWYDASLRLPLN